MPFRSENRILTITFIVCLPFFAVLFCFLMAYVFVRAGVSSETPNWVLLPGLLGYYFVPSIFGITYLFLAAGFVVWAWIRCTLTSTFRLSLLVGYTVVLLIYFSYLTWWFLTGQKLEFI